MPKKVDTKKAKPKKVRSTTYDKPLKIHGTFDEAMKALVKEPRVKYTVTFPDKGKKD